MELLKSFKRRLEDGKPVIGPFMKAVDPAFVECAGHAGFDFVILDMEHGPAGFPDLQNLIRGAEAAGVLPVVRTYDASETAIGKALDLGAAGIQVPQVKSVQEGEDIVQRELAFDHAVKKCGIKPSFRAGKTISLDGVGKLDVGIYAAVLIFHKGKKGSFSCVHCKAPYPAAPAASSVKSIAWSDAASSDEISRRHFLFALWDQL